MEIEAINVVIDKSKIYNNDYNVLEKALTYNIQRIENSSSNTWKYFLITDSGRTPVMRKTARKIRVNNLIQSKFDYSTYNEPVKNMIEDILEKDSKESYFIQMSDLIAKIVSMCFNYYLTKKRFAKTFI